MDTNASMAQNVDRDMQSPDGFVQQYKPTDRPWFLLFWIYPMVIFIPHRLQPNNLKKRVLLQNVFFSTQFRDSCKSFTFRNLTISDRASGKLPFVGSLCKSIGNLPLLS